MVKATQDFLAMLTDAQRRQGVFPFTPLKAASAAQFGRKGPPGGGGHPPGPPPGQPPRGGGAGRGPGGPLPGFVGERYGQAVWSNYPVSDVPRPGLQLGDLTPAQRSAALHLLQVLLSPKGYQKVLDIMGSDRAPSEQGQPFASGEQVCTLGVFGTPSPTEPWMVELGGHHLGLNVVIAGSHGVMTPTLTGSQPAIYTRNGTTVRVLAGENDKAFALLDSLDAAQRRQAILNYEVGDLVQGPGHDGETLVPGGLKASAMTPRQQALLLEVIAEWAGIVNDAYATPRLAEIKAGLGDTWLAWSGPTTHAPGHNGSAYYRIQGPKVLIELSPQGVGGDATLHVHTIHRDPERLRPPLHHPMSRCGWLLLLLAISAPAGAHRLDEYLQATTIAVGRDHLTLQLRLTADVPVAPKVLADIGTRPQAYAEQVRRDLSLSVDDRPVPLRLVAPGFPGAGALRGGVGDIQLRFEADLPPGDGPHALVLENQHDRAIAVYLVNCRAPDNPGIRIVGQQRNHEQSIYRLDFTTGDVPATRGAATQHLASQTRRAVLPTYFAQGVRHILTGCDHLLFAACLVLAASTLWDLVRVITAFTVAHSITLTLAALGWVHLPASVVEPVIWASIVFVAVQNIFWPRAAAGWPWPSSSACFMAWALPAGSWRS